MGSGLVLGQAEVLFIGIGTGLRQISANFDGFRVFLGNLVRGSGLVLGQVLFIGFGTRSVYWVF